MICLIHNHEEDRFSFILDQIDSLSQILSETCDISTIQLGSQPALYRLKFPFRQYLLRHFSWLQLVAHWERFLGKANIFKFVRLLISSVSIPLKLAFTASPAKRQSLADNALKEICLSWKHQHAYVCFFQDQFDLMLLLESDCYMTDVSESAQRLLASMSLAMSQLDPTYIQVGRGYPHSRDFAQLAARTILSRGYAFDFYDRPSTNTTSAYLCNRGFAELMVASSLTCRNPFCDPSDWSINRMFLVCEQTKTACHSFHPVDPAFEHGSLTGKYPSVFINH